jgi:hypothetical protein
MIQAIELENFKGIAARQRIDFAPLTLLFGANSAGKSTILQALLYLHEVLERGSADIDRTELGGDMLELGGFARLVHRHESDRAIILRAEFATPGGLERFGRDLADFPFPDLDDEVESAWLELTIRFRTSANFRGPLVERAVIGVNEGTEPLVWLEVAYSPPHGYKGKNLFVMSTSFGPPIVPHVRRILKGWFNGRHRSRLRYSDLRPNRCGHRSAKDAYSRRFALRSASRSDRMVGGRVRP